mmetsp:Transcript_62963/g.111898  ORF Transcript_62963/g.111898 Transcript_62963/m.111898 type:complete len:235 (-) Transcript_62963:61-765(-)
MAGGRMLAPEDLEGVPTIELLNELKRRHHVLNRPATRAALLGPPCVGKQVQAEAFRRAFGVCRIPVAELLQNSAGASGSVDDRALTAVASYLERPQCRRGFILEGFPTTVVQAERLQRLLEKQEVPLQHAIFLDASEEQLLERCSGRLIHPATGRRYHDQFRPPLDQGVDDFTGEALIRPEFDAAKFQKNLASYREDGGLLHQFFSRAGLARDVSAAGSADEVATRVTSVVDAR